MSLNVTILSFLTTLPHLAALYHADPYHAYRNLETNSLHSDSNNINQNFSSQPYFDFSVPRNVTTRVGQTAFLNCRVEQLGDKLVRFFSPSDKNHVMGRAIFFSLPGLSRLSVDAISSKSGNHIFMLFSFLASASRYRGYENEIFTY